MVYVSGVFSIVSLRLASRLPETLVAGLGEAVGTVVCFFEFRDHPPYPLVNIQKSRKSPFFRGKSTICMAVFKSYVSLPGRRNTVKGNGLLYYAMYLKLVRSNDFKDFYLVRQCLFELLKDMIHDLAKDIRSGFCSQQHIVI